ncbi:MULTISPECIES: GAP1-N2 domain-containing protein [unclassified Modestobacter]|uniref:GAP1-N2 domain-containing protein n=1 Tax=unclassified Modestobacter TaxID=2643866 RepID=UPI0022AB1E9A|nr:MULTISPECIES: hypothetical protein [unclassified Modestobacter]MCZ2826070.1 hypothetical protein [Modestobacter sp. VKM Ac-2981]MCZ2852865.1 hypothetical protein [Modestobacter sp. VKM Ac-2982]
MFEVLTYTDCAAEESVNGRSGFQFQAESEGATPTDEDRISSGLLHVVPPGLDPERPEVHPPTCAYTAVDGRYYLSRGRSTGRTLSGRPGNQVTQAIVTGTATDILPLRPAQLYSSSAWSLEPAVSREIPGWEAPLEINPAFETAGLHEMVTSDPWARDLLPGFLTMVEQATAERRVRLIVVHPEQDVVMRWIALASLFEDGGQALRLTFRVYSPNPVSESAHIVGAHPSISPDLTAAGGAGYNLVDLDRHMITSVEVSPSAALHAAWFLEHDPYEALDAVETSRRWAAVLPAGSAAQAAAVACLDGAEVAADRTAFDAVLGALAALADAGQGDELEAYGDALLDAVVARPPRPDDDIELLTAAVWRLHGAGEDALAAGLTLAGLEWAVRLPEAAGGWAASHTVPRTASEDRRLSWPDAEAAAHAADLVGRALAAATDKQLPAWFSLARSLGTGLAADRIAPEIQRLARQWGRRPELTASAFSWLHIDRVTAGLQEELCARFGAGDPAAIAALQAGEWDWMVGRDFVVEPRERPLSTWLASRTLSTASPEQRLATLRQVAPLLPDWASAVFLEARGDRVEVDEVVTWLHSHRIVSPGLAAVIEGIVRVHFRAGHPRLLQRLAHALRGEGITGLPPSLLNFLADHERMVAGLREAEQKAAAPRNVALREVATFPGAWLRLYADDLAEVLLSVSDEAAMLTVSEAAAGTLDQAVEQAVLRLARRPDVRALVGTLRLLSVDPGRLGRAGRRGLTAIWENPQEAPVRDRLLELLPPRWEPLMQDFEASLGKGRRSRMVVRGARRILDTRGRD